MWFIQIYNHEFVLIYNQQQSHVVDRIVVIAVTASVTLQPLVLILNNLVWFLSLALLNMVLCGGARVVQVRVLVNFCAIVGCGSRLDRVTDISFT